METANRNTQLLSFITDSEHGLDELQTTFDTKADDIASHDRAICCASKKSNKLIPIVLERLDALQQQCSSLSIPASFNGGLIAWSRREEEGYDIFRNNAQIDPDHAVEWLQERRRATNRIIQTQITGLTIALNHAIQEYNQRNPETPYIRPSRVNNGNKASDCLIVSALAMIVLGSVLMTLRETRT